MGKSHAELEGTQIVEKKQPRSLLNEAIRQVLRNRLALISLVVILIQIFMAIFAPWIVAHDPLAQNLSATYLSPGSDGHWLGTDQYGRDVWSRMAHGARISLFVGISATALGLIGGTILGLTAGYFRRLDGIIMRILDLMFAFPNILLALLIVAILGPSIVNTIIALSIWAIPSIARILRSRVLTVKKQEFITAQRSIGASYPRILFKHILPNCTAPLIVVGAMEIGTAILATAALGYLGLGAQPPAPEWGAMVSEGQEYMFNAPHLVLIPGIVIMISVFAFNLFGDALRDALDPKTDINK
ncbi:ABC transporter permease [Natribacillus halophilus]|uniref:Peptide/nickel transport system permease protein n=1 Tax=Natribacillus halophilus TaxID=549003 RepID=A0A1G8R7S9_9BACI|nr:ABC transporter permease [Natribacillus halophilus]SDJ13084.1 peptide/nickel transport system permease protein [Natribacillus halophilus]